MSHTTPRTIPRFLTGSLAATLALSSLAPTAAPQAAAGGLPFSSLHALPPDAVESVPTVVLGTRSGHAREETEHPLGLSTANSGSWTPLADGARLWRLRLERPGAGWLLVTFDRFQLTGGASLYLYDDERRQVLGAYTRADNRLDGRLDARALVGSALTLEYHEPAQDRGTGALVLGSLFAGPTELRSQQEPTRLGFAADCNVDVACTPGEPWQTETRAIVKIEAVQNCTGVLLNNTSGDGTPYVLTADHCGNLTYANFWFHWKRANCGEDGSEEGHLLLQGSHLVVRDKIKDFQLVRLNRTPPPEMNVHYAGWDRSGERPTGVACLHHPAGGEMKVSLERDQLKRQKRYWKVRRWDVGITERGSSGAPLFDAAHRVVALLKGGPATCRKPQGDLFVRLEEAWPDLAPFLDPAGTGASTLDAADLGGEPVKLAVTSVRAFEDPERGAGYRVRGSGFSSTSLVRLDGEFLSGKLAHRFSNGRIDIAPLELAAGSHTLEVQEGKLRAELAFEVPPPNTDPGDGHVDQARRRKAP